MSDLFQRVNTSGEVSESVLLLHGVPQGPLLVPVLLAIYVSKLVSLLEALEVRYHHYAEETQFYFETIDCSSVEKY